MIEDQGCQSSEHLARMGVSSDEFWAVVEPLMPSDEGKCGRRFGDHRASPANPRRPATKNWETRPSRRLTVQISRRSAGCVTASSTPPEKTSAANRPSAPPCLGTGVWATSRALPRGRVGPPAGERPVRHSVLQMARRAVAIHATVLLTNHRLRVAYLNAHPNARNVQDVLRTVNHQSKSGESPGGGVASTSNPPPEAASR
jgi:hypothetical protein